MNFHESLSHPVPPAHFSVLLKSLWYDKKGDWKTAHDLVDSLAGAEAAGGTSEPFYQINTLN
jgi:hypothetical protein